MKKLNIRTRYAAVGGLLLAGVTLFALSLVAEPNSQGAGRSKEISGILVEPGTEILFELSRSVDPRPIAERGRAVIPGGGEIEYLPDVPPADGKYVAGWCNRWSGDYGLVWATNTHLLYVAPDQGGVGDCLSLEPAYHPPTHNEEMSLYIHTRGGELEKALRSVGFRDIAEVRGSWLGSGDIRLKAVRIRSREEAGRDRPLPPKAFDLVTPDEYEDGKLVKKGGKPLYIHPGKPVETPEAQRGRTGAPVDKASRADCEKR